MDDTLIKGDITELQCILDFQKRGFYCSIPYSGSCRYDLIVDVNNKLLRIQCKSCYYKAEKGILIISTVRQTINTKGIKKYTYTKEEVDYFYTCWGKYSFLIPIEEMEKKQMYLRVKAPSFITNTINVADDYLFDKIIDSIINNKKVKKYTDNMFISIDNQGNEKLWNTEELKQTFSEKQIRYIRRKVMENTMIYNYKWRYKEFPSL